MSKTARDAARPHHEELEPSARPDLPLAGRIALVTGASSGIGRAIALATAAAGADVVLTYHSREGAAHETARAITSGGRRAQVLQLDLAEAASIASLAPRARDAFGRVDIWVNNGGADILTGDAASLSPRDRLQLVLDVDLRGTILASWQAAELMKEQPAGGVIINMSWDHALTGMAGTNPQIFAAAKGGVLSFSKALARTVAPHVRVNVVAPGWIATAFAQALPDDRKHAVRDATPLGRWGTPDDVANAVVFLASPASAFLTGQTILVGGGTVM